jgi:hypothetical protein
LRIPFVVEMGDSFTTIILSKVYKRRLWYNRVMEGITKNGAESDTPRNAVSSFFSYYLTDFGNPP